VEEITNNQQVNDKLTSQTEYFEYISPLTGINLIRLVSQQ